MSASAAIPIGSAVTIKRNDAGVAAGATGRFAGTHGESGNLLVDVDGRGRVAFTRDQVDHPALSNGRHPWIDNVIPEVKVMSEEPKRAYRGSGVITVGDHKITLSISHSDLAKALGLGSQALASIAENAGVRPAMAGSSLRYLAADIYAIHELMQAMAEFEVSAKVAVKILAKIAAKEKGS